MAIGYGEACQKPQLRVLDRVERTRERERRAAIFRAAVWKHANYCCEYCGRMLRRTMELVPNRGEVHHLRGRNVAVEDRYNPKAAVLLCVLCHRQAQRHEITLKASR